jgi:hypothetical protein
MRTVDLRAMGGAWTRMRATAVALLLTAAVVCLAALPSAMLRPRSTVQIAFGAGLVLTAVATLRPYFAVVHGELRRRRAFEPARVREVAAMAAAGALAGAVLGAAALVLALVPSWISFLGAGGRAVPAGPGVLWAAGPVAGAVLAAAAFLLRKDASLQVCARLGDGLGVAWDQAAALYVRFVGRPGDRIVGAVEDVGLPAVESGVSRALMGTGGLAGLAERSLPWVPTVLGLAVVLAVAFGLLSQGLRP